LAGSSAVASKLKRNMWVNLFRFTCFANMVLHEYSSSKRLQFNGKLKVHLCFHDNVSFSPQMWWMLSLVTLQLNQMMMNWHHCQITATSLKLIWWMPSDYFTPSASLVLWHFMYPVPFLHTLIHKFPS
jgi:hypothetical protein